MIWIPIKFDAQVFMLQSSGLKISLMEALTIQKNSVTFVQGLNRNKRIKINLM
jgi:hypothetical protein